MNCSPNYKLCYNNQKIEMMSRYCISIQPTPILNVADFKAVFGTNYPPLDEKGLLRNMEMIAFPGTKFTIIKTLKDSILQVATKEYPYSPLYIDARFVKLVEKSIPERKKILPSRERILESLLSSLGLPYIWGGNWGKGIPEILELYQTKKDFSLHPAQSCTGVDCSGLLYQATAGCIPRNTSELMKFGAQVSFLQNVKPLDIVLWEGHVIILLSKSIAIESLIGKGVILSDLKKRLENVKKLPFVIRRFIN